MITQFFVQIAAMSLRPVGPVSQRDRCLSVVRPIQNALLQRHRSIGKIGYRNPYRRRPLPHSTVSTFSMRFFLNNFCYNCASSASSPRSQSTPSGLISTSSARLCRGVHMARVASSALLADSSDSLFDVSRSCWHLASPTSLLSRNCSRGESLAASSACNRSFA